MTLERFDSICAGANLMKRCRSTEYVNMSCSACKCNSEQDYVDMSPTYVCDDTHPWLLRTSCSTRSNREDLFRSVLLSPAMDVMPSMILSSLRK